MPLFKDSYDTSIALPFDMKTTRLAIVEALILSGLRDEHGGVHVEGGVEPIFLYGRNDREAQIPLYSHPILVQHRDQEFLCTDMRLYVRKESLQDGGEPAPKSISEYNFHKSRGIMNLIWLSSPERIRTGLQFANSVFSTWLSDTIARTYALNPRDRILVGIIASFYYQSLFSDQTEFDEDEKQKMILHTIKVTKSPADLVTEVLDRLTWFKDIDSFCENVKKILENVRLEKFNRTLLLNFVSHSWFGNDAKKIIPVALEHPPTWVAIVYASLMDRSYKSSQIARTADVIGKRGASEEFVNTFKAMVVDAKAQ